MLQKNRGDFASTTRLKRHGQVCQKSPLYFFRVYHVSSCVTVVCSSGHVVNPEKKKTNGKIGTVYPQPMASPLGLIRQSK